MNNTARTEPSPRETFVCDWCGDEYDKSERELVQGDSICQTCYEDDAGHCDECGCAEHYDSMRFHQDELFCERCFNENYNYCAGCECTRHNDDLFVSDYDSQLRCIDCNSEHYEQRQLIRNYSYKPEPIFYHDENTERTHQANKEKRVFFGFELEIERGEDCSLTKNEIAKMINRFMDEHGMLDLLYFKYDSSLDDGFEIISHPMSYAFFKRHKKVFAELLKGLRNHGVISYQSGNCGLHIHLGRQAFTHSHFLKFQNFWNVKKNHDMLERLSQRKRFGYCSLTNRTKTDLINMSKQKDMRDSSNRSVALNCTNEKTVEVRIFRGTLNTKSFFKAFESVFAIFDYTKKMSFSALQITRKNLNEESKKVSDLIAKNGRLDGWIAPITEGLIHRDYFYSYIKSQKNIFPNLNLFMDKKFGTKWKMESSISNIKRLNKLIKNERIYL
jgi:hypothetical protein